METKKIEVIQDIHKENEMIAHRIKEKLEAKGMLVINVMGAPGAGKTSSLIQIIKHLEGLKAYVVEGDIESDIDTQTLQGLGIETVQINTKGACHLDAPLLETALETIEFTEPGIVFIENIGNLVCPAEFEIGEHLKMLISSAAEGSDKPYKYPLAFEKASVILLNKADLKEYVDFKDAFFIKGVRGLNKVAPLFEVSAKSGENFKEVATFLKEQWENVHGKH
jgi:hydrogenase nickel incorporation protein HypB